MSDTTTTAILFKAATSLSNVYLEDLSSDFSNQMISFRALFREDIKQVRSVFDLAGMLVIRNYRLLSSFRYLYTAFLLFLTIPVNVAKAERTFSRELIKTYFRNTMSQDRLSGLTNLSIENAEAQKLNIDKVVEDLSRLTTRRMQF